MPIHGASERAAEEREILFPPLARMEVRGEPEVRAFQGRELTYFKMQVHV